MMLQPRYAAVAHGLRLYTDAMRRLIAERLRKAYGEEWWEKGVLRALPPKQREELAFTQRLEPGRSDIEYLDASHFVAVVTDSENHRAAFGAVFPNWKTAQGWLRDVETVQNSVAHPESGDFRLDAAKDSLSEILRVLAKAAVPEAKAVEELRASIAPLPPPPPHPQALPPPSLAGRPPVRIMVQEAVNALGEPVTGSQIREWVMKRYSGTKYGTIAAQTVICTVNNPSRVHFPQNQRPRIANDSRYDLLHRNEQGLQERYDPARHGTWAIVQRRDGSLGVARMDKPPGDDTPLHGPSDALSAKAPAPPAVVPQVPPHGAGGRRLQTRALVAERVRELCTNFEHYVRAYDANPPFQRPGQYEWHRRTIDHRRELGSVAAAVADDDFLKALWQTLDAWGMNSRAAELVPLADFKCALLEHLELLKWLEPLRIDADPSLPQQVGEALWQAVEAIPVTRSQNQ